MPDPTNPEAIEAALRPFGWTIGPEFWERYHSDPWVFNLANAIGHTVAAALADRDAAVDAARQEGEQRAQAWADLVQLYGDQLMIDQATTMGLWPEQAAVPVPEEETQWMTCPECGGLGLHPEHNDRLCPTCFGKREVLRPVPEEETQS